MFKKRLNFRWIFVVNFRAQSNEKNSNLTLLLKRLHAFMYGECSRLQVP